MIQAHIFVDGKIWTKRLIHHAPSKGDTIRFDGEPVAMNPNEYVDQYAIVTEVIWCYEEKYPNADRVNIRCEFEKAADRRNHE